MEPNLAGSIYVRSSIKLLHLVPFGQQTWPLLLKIEQMVKLHVFGNNSKTVYNIRNLTRVKMIRTARSNYPEILKKIWLPILELLPFFHQIFKILILFVFYFKNYKRYMLSLNSKHVQHVKIYLACNFKVNLITHLEVIALFSSNFKNVNTFHPLFQKL